MHSFLKQSSLKRRLAHPRLNQKQYQPLAKSNIDSNYASVTEQSGIKAGDGGFTVNVQGNTALVGGAITSTKAAVDNNKNTFTTGGTLTTSDIQNSASYNANSVSVNVGMGSTPGQSASAGMNAVWVLVQTKELIKRLLL
jgi:hypothetical protein